MKNLLMILTLLLLASCGGQTSETQKLTMEEENAIADSIVSALDAEKTELSETTEESIQEIDSLLETL